MVRQILSIPVQSFSMTENFIQIKLNQINFDSYTLSKHVWLVILHYKRIPPHIGLMIDGNYNSLTIKGHETNIDFQVLLKTIAQKKIEACFIELQKQPVFSSHFQLEILQHYINQFDFVKQNYATCLSPIKLFLSEFYGVETISDELFFELLIRLKDNEFLKCFTSNSAKFDSNTITLPCYTNKELQELILKERQPYYRE